MKYKFLISFIASILLIIANVQEGYAVRRQGNIIFYSRQELVSAINYTKSLPYNWQGLLPRYEQALRAGTAQLPNGDIIRLEEPQNSAPIQNNYALLERQRQEAEQRRAEEEKKRLEEEKRRREAQKRLETTADRVQKEIRGQGDSTLDECQAILSSLLVSKSKVDDYQFPKNFSGETEVGRGFQDFKDPALAQTDLPDIKKSAIEEMTKNDDLMARAQLFLEAQEAQKAMETQQANSNVAVNHTVDSAPIPQWREEIDQAVKNVNDKLGDVNEFIADVGFGAVEAVYDAGKGVGAIANDPNLVIPAVDHFAQSVGQVGKTLLNVATDYPSVTLDKISDEVSDFNDTPHKGRIVGKVVADFVMAEGAVKALQAVGEMGVFCFTGDTQVCVTENSRKQIFEIRVGDFVQSCNLAEGVCESRKVLAVFRNVADHLHILYYGCEEVRTTDDHPFYVLGKGWTEARWLEVGDQFLSISGEPVTLEKIGEESGEFPVFNIEVEGNNNYYAADVLVHNCNRANEVLGVAGRAVVEEELLAGRAELDSLGNVVNGRVWESVERNVIQVTPQGVALPPGRTIPEGLVENPYRPGSYGTIESGKFKETLRIDPPTPRGQNGPEYSHYHLNGGKQHFAPGTGRKDPGFK